MRTAATGNARSPTDNNCVRQTICDGDGAVLPAIVILWPSMYGSKQAECGMRMTYRGAVNELLNHVVRRLRLLLTSRDVAHAIWSTELILRSELDPRARLLLNLLYHFAALPDHDSDHRTWNGNLSEMHDSKEYSK